MNPVAGLPRAKNSFQWRVVDAGPSGCRQLDLNAASKSGRDQFAGDNTFVLFDFEAQTRRAQCWGRESGEFRGACGRREAPGQVPVSGRLCRLAPSCGAPRSQRSQARPQAAPRHSGAARRCKATGSAVRRARSRAMPSAVVVARPPPRTGRPRRITARPHVRPRPATRPLRRGPARPSAPDDRGAAGSRLRVAAAVRGECDCA